MSEMIELSEEHYRSLARAATARGPTRQTLLSQIIDALPAPDARHVYETEGWFRHLGATGGANRRIRPPSARRGTRWRVPTHEEWVRFLREVSSLTPQERI